MRSPHPFSLILFAALLSYTAIAQSPQVPHKMHFADMTLTIRDDARKEIQKDVDAMTLSPKHFNVKAERAKTYFPIIEKVFAEENVPDDFKYLVLQESSLIADAVSPSNAVGFWQFKDYTAIEMGLRVDREIDERMNIVSASRGAAKYFKKNNMFFDNWLYALQAYQMGAGAVMQLVKDDEHSVKHMEVTSKTYWYVKKFLAHKIAFEESVKGPGQVQVTAIENKGRRSLSDLAKEISVEEEILKTNNKWVKNGTIPDDRTYMILIPVTGNVNDIKLSEARPLALTTAAKVARPTSGMIKSNRINGLLTILAVQGETPTLLAARAAVDLSDFLKWNDISISDPVRAGQVYFLSRKRARATESYHTVRAGENLWLISQQYGVQLKKLRKYNRLGSDAVQAGETLWLSSKRPKDAAQFNNNTSVAEVNNKDTFSWTADEEAKPVLIVAPVTESVTVIEERQPASGVVQPAILEVKSDSLSSRDTNVVVPDINNREMKDSVSAEVNNSVVTNQASGQIIVTPAAARKTEHVVQPKETLYAIAQLYNIGVMDLVNWNHLNLQDGIKPGQQLKLYSDEPVADATATSPSEQLLHEVKTTDTLYSVARKYGVTIKDLMDWNGKKDFNLTVGEKLKILRR